MIHKQSRNSGMGADIIKICRKLDLHDKQFGMILVLPYVYCIEHQGIKLANWLLHCNWHGDRIG